MAFHPENTALQAALNADPVALELLPQLVPAGSGAGLIIPFRAAMMEVMSYVSQGWCLISIIHLIR